MKLSFQDAQNRSLAVFRVPGRNVVRWSSVVFGSRALLLL
nr:MAG TPA: hypothetical protein [Caudoviricetes sp.]